MKILISDKSSPRCAEILRAGGHQVDERNGLDPAALKAIIADYDGLIVRSATTVSSDLLSAAEKMKVIGRAGSGVDNIDLAAASERGMAVLNTPGGNSNSVAEMTLAFMLMMARDLYTAIHSLKSHRWEKKKFKGLEISGKSLGLLGYGRISRMVATKARAMGMVVLCYDPKISKNILDDDGLRITASLDELLTNSDYISMHLSKRDDTINFLDAAALEKVKPGCCIINCARGGLIDETALLDGLNSGRIAAAALDVFDEEPPLQFDLVDHPRVICVPHIGASSEESQENVAVMIAEQFIDFFAGKPVINRVN